MADINTRKLPAGIQSFKKIREEGYLYVDKTDIVWRLANNGMQYNYQAAPAASASRCLSIRCNSILRAGRTCLKD